MVNFFPLFIIFITLVKFTFNKLSRFSSLNPYSESIRNNSKLTIMAHRGFFGYFPEHAIRGFELAYFMGTDFLETDIALTKDGKAVIFHDSYLDDVTDVNDYPEYENRRRSAIIEGLEQNNKLFICDFTYEEIMRLRLKQRYATRPTLYNKEFKLLLLVELIEFVVKNNVNFNKTTGIYVEPKYVVFFQQELGINLNSIIKGILSKYNLLDQNSLEYKYCPIVLQSFEYDTLKYFKANGNLPQVALMRWREFYNLFKLAEVCDAYGVEVDFVLYERIDDRLLVNGTYYKNQNEFKTNVLPNPLKESIEHLGKRFLPATQNKLAAYFASFNRGLQVWNVNNDGLKFSHDPTIEYAKLVSIGVSAFFSDFCDTAMFGVKHSQNLLN